MTSTPPWSTRFGKSSLGDLREVLALQLDPYYLAPLWPDPVSLAALQARALLDAGRATESDLAEVAARSRKSALANPKAQLAYDRPVEELLADEYAVAPLRRHDCRRSPTAPPPSCWPPGTRRARWAERPAWITGIDHRIETHALGARDLTRSPSTTKAAEKAGVGDGPGRRGRAARPVRPPGAHPAPRPWASVTAWPSTRRAGALAANPFMSAGLIRIGEAAARIARARPHRAVAHATSGPCLQQNLVCVLEA